MIYIRHSPYRNHHSDMHTPTVLPQRPNNAGYRSPMGDKLERSPRRLGFERDACAFNRTHSNTIPVGPMKRSMSQLFGLQALTAC